MKTTAIFPGSFDPFTIGHDDIARRALLIADRLVIAVGVNDKKKYESDTEQRVEAIARIYADNPRVEVVAYEGLTIDLARHLHANFIVNRGGAKAADVLSIIQHAHDCVAEKYGIDLACEVKLLGFDA